MNTYYVAGIPYSDELFHHGIRGQKWGVRKKEYENNIQKLNAKSKIRNALKIGGIVAAAGLSLYGAYKINQIQNDSDFFRRSLDNVENVFGPMSEKGKSARGIRDAYNKSSFIGKYQTLRGSDKILSKIKQGNLIDVMSILNDARFR